MRISFTNKEIEELIEFLERVCDACCDEEVKTKHQIISKFRNAQSRSRASKSKIQFIHEAERKKKNTEHDKIRRDILKLYKESTS